MIFKNDNGLWSSFEDTVVYLKLFDILYADDILYAEPRDELQAALNGMLHNCNIWQLEILRKQKWLLLSVCLCVSVCPADILVFYFSAIRRDIDDLKFIQDTYRVVLNSLKKH